MKSNKLNIFICLACGIVIIGLVVFPMGAKGLISNISNIDIRWIFAALGCMIVFWFLESVALHILIKTEHKQQRLFKTICVNMGGQYFHSITPFASGGQPFQAYYLNKQGVDLGVAVNCLVAKFIIYQITLVCLSFVMLILRLTYFKQYMSNFSLIVVLGFVVNVATMLWALSLLLFKKTTRRVAHFIILILSKMHIVKDYEGKILYIDNELEKFNNCFYNMKKNIPAVILTFFLSVCHLIAYMAVPYMIYRAFGLSEIDFLTIISAQAFVMLVSSFVPIPGAGGGAEGAFYLFFRRFFPHEGQFGVALLFWRFITFYFTVIVGVFFALAANKGEKDKLSK